MRHTEYLTNAFRPHYLESEFKRLVPADSFDLLVGTGLSGTLALATLRARLGVEIAILRKDRDDTHSRYKLESTADPEGARWIFVDDLIDMGDTRARVTTHMAGYNGSVYVGDFLYSPSNVRTTKHAKFKKAPK